MFSNSLTTTSVGGAGDDSLFGDIGDDLFHGDAGSDTIFGGGGDDTLIGGEGADNLNGGQGSDVLYGETGDDTLLYAHDPFAEELDRLFGGAGSDTLILDMVSDFSGFIDIVLEIKAYALLLAAGQDPGAGEEYVFTTFGLRVSGFETVVLLIDGQQVDATLPPIPIALDDAATAVDGGGVVTGSVGDNDNVPPGAVFILESGPQVGDFTLNPDGTFEFDPLNDFVALGEGESQDLTYTYSLNLQGQAPSFGALTLTVNGANDAPVGVDETFTINAGDTLTGVLNVTDPDGDPLTVIEADIPAIFANASLTGLNYSFETFADDNVTDTATFTVADAFGATTTFSITFEIVAGPTFLGSPPPLQFQTAEVNTGATNSFDASTLFSLPGAGYVFTATGLPSGVSINATTGVISGVPSNTANGLFTATVTVTDGQGRSAFGPLGIASFDSAILGDAADNDLVGDAASNIIEGGPGNDYLRGGDGPDIYRYTAGEGFDVILDNFGADDETLLLSGYTLDQLSFSRFGGRLTDLLITPVGSETTFTEGVLIQEGIEIGSRDGQISRVVLDDGTILATADLAALALAGEASASGDELIGLGNFSDVIRGGPGPDTLSGLSGADTYVFEVGDGADLVRDNANTRERDNFNDTVQFVGRNFADATFSTPGNLADLLIDFGGGDSVLIELALNNNAAQQIENFVFEDRTLTIVELRQLVVDQLTSAGDDVVYQPSLLVAAEVIEGGPGNDTLIGTGGDDTYVYRPGDGFDVIRDAGNIGTENFLEIHGFTLDIDPVTGAPTPTSQVQFDQRIPGLESFRLLLDNGDPAERGSIDMINALVTGLNGDRFSGFTFVDQGLTLTGDEMRALLTAQQRTAGDDVIVGFNSINDTIEAGAGDDFVTGANGNDTFIFRTGDDGLTIHDFSTAGTETLLLPDLTLAQLEFTRDRSRSSEDLLITNTADAGDLITYRGLLLNLGSQNDRIQDMNGDILTSADLRNLMLAQEIAEFIAAGVSGTINGFSDHADNFTTTQGLDATLLGGSGSDTYTVTTTDGRDTVLDTAIIGTDTIILQGINVADFDTVQGGTFQVLTNGVLTNDVTLRFDAANSLTIHNFGGIESFVFDDATILKADFVASFITPFAQQAPEITGSGGGTVTGSTAAQEVFRVGNNDTVVFAGGQIGDDIVTIGVNGKYAIDLTLDGAWAGASVTFERSILNTRDFTIVIDNGVDPYETILVTGAFGSFEFNAKVTTLTISDDGVARAPITGVDIYQQMVDDQIAAGADRVFGSNEANDTFDAAPGDRFYQGGDGSDTYLYTIGDDRAIFDDGGFRNADTLIVTGYNLADATLRRDFSGEANTLVIDYGTDEIVLPGQFNLADGRVDFFIFDDQPTAIGSLELIQLFMDQQNADPDAFAIVGTEIGDTLLSAGDRHLLGGGGNDIYQITSATGTTWISEGGFRNSDTVVMPVASTEVTFRQDPTDRGNLIIDFDAGGRVLIFSGYSGTNSFVNNFQFTDTTLDRSDVFARIHQDNLAEEVDFAGRSSAETLIGGAGDDAFQGNGGNDVFQYARGDGNDVYADGGFRTFDVVEISGFALSELRFQTTEAQPNSLKVSFEGADGSILVGSFFSPGSFNSSIEILRLVNDIDPATGAPRELNIDDVRRIVVEQQATAGDDRIVGFFNVDDTLSGGGGQDTLIGLTGADTYSFTAGDGVVFVNDQGITGQSDTLIFNGVDINGATVRRLAAAHEDLVFEFAGSSDRVVVSNQVISSGDDDTIETYVFGQTTLTLDDVYAIADGGGSIGAGPAAPLTGGSMLISGGNISLASTGTTSGGVTTAVTTPTTTEEETPPPAEEPAPATSFGTLSSNVTSSFTTLTGATAGSATISLNLMNTPSSGADFLTGGAGADLIDALAGDDTVLGGAGADTLRGGAGNDSLSGEGGADRLIGGLGNDRLSGSFGADRLAGGAGADTLGGGAQNDALFGGAGADRLFGGGGNDRLSGGKWNDALRGGGGDDTLVGGAGRDRLTGDAGADRFVFIANQGRDFVTDFTRGEDLIVMRAAGSFDALDISTFQGDAIIRAAGTQFRLDGVDGDDLTAADFIFL